MENFDLKKYLAEGKLLKEDVSEYEVGDKVKFNPSTMKDKGFEDLQQYYGGLIGVIEKVSQDELEIKLNKSITPPGGGNIDGILLMKSEGDYEMLAEGKLLKEVRGPLKMELNIKKGEGIDVDMIRDDYGFDYNVDEVPVEDLFDENGFALKDMVIVYDQRDDMYLMDAEDMEKYH